MIINPTKELKITSIAKCGWGDIVGDGELYRGTCPHCLVRGLLRIKREHFDIEIEMPHCPNCGKNVMNKKEAN